MAYASITKPSLYFDGKIYLGSASAVTVTGLGFQPDLVWVKDRDNGNNHCWVDAVRGVGKYIESDNTGAEVDNSTNSISAFTSDGFTTGTANPANEQASTTLGFMSWNWKANGAGSANTDGTIDTTSTSVDTTSGFSISKYTGDGSSGATIGHGLGVKPKVIIVKRLGTTGNWFCQHGSLGATKNMVLNSTNAVATFTACWNDTEPTSSVFTVGNDNDVNASAGTYVAYCFSPVKGYSSFGTYKGSGGADGPFIYTGFKPAFVIVKKTNGVDNWFVLDNKRNTSNPEDKYLLPDTTGTSATYTFFDYISTGFKIRSTGGGHNGNGDSYIYMAFAQNPLVANVGQSIPATAR